MEGRLISCGNSLVDGVVKIDRTGQFTCLCCVGTKTADLIALFSLSAGNGQQCGSRFASPESGTNEVLCVQLCTAMTRKVEINYCEQV